MAVELFAALPFPHFAGSTLSTYLYSLIGRRHKPSMFKFGRGCPPNAEADRFVIVADCRGIFSQDISGMSSSYIALL